MRRLFAAAICLTLLAAAAHAIGLRRSGGGGAILTPDGTAVLAPGTGAFSPVPPGFTAASNGSSVTTPYGVWTWGGQLANPGVGNGEQDGFFQLKLNGKVTARAASIFVTCGHNLIFLDFDSNAWVMQDNAPYANNAFSPLSAMPPCSSAFTATISTTNMTVNPPASNIGQGQVITSGAQPGTQITGQTSGTPGGAGVYTVSISQSVPSPTAMTATLVPEPLPTAPITGGSPSAPNSSFTCPGTVGGPLTSVDGTWSCGGLCPSYFFCAAGNYDMLLNGVRTQAMWGTKLEINSNGQAFVQRADSSWAAYLAYNYVPSPSGAPGSIPVAYLNNVNPVIGGTSTQSVPSLSQSGVTITPCPSDPCVPGAGVTKAATPSVTMSDGSAFAGTWTVVDPSSTGIFRMSLSGPDAGSLVFARTLTSGDVGNAFGWQIEPVMSGLTYNVLAQTFLDVNIVP